MNFAREDQQLLAGPNLRALVTQSHGSPTVDSRADGFRLPAVNLKGPELSVKWGLRGICLFLLGA